MLRPGIVGMRGSYHYGLETTVMHEMSIPPARAQSIGRFFCLPRAHIGLGMLLCSLHASRIYTVMWSIILAEELIVQLLRTLTSVC